VTLFIADSNNATVRAVGPDGIIRNLGSEGRVELGEPTRVAYAPRRGLLWVADSANDRLVPLVMPKIAPNLVPPPRPATGPTRRVGG
jgi:hypothetical protein